MSFTHSVCSNAMNRLEKGRNRHPLQKMFADSLTKTYPSFQIFIEWGREFQTRHAVTVPDLLETEVLQCGMRNIDEPV